MSYDRYETQRRRRGFGATSQRTTFGYWVPLALTVTVATIGLAAWVWKERGDDDDDERDGRHTGNYGDPNMPKDGGYASGIHQEGSEDPGIVTRMSGALRRTPSPQQFFDEAGRRVVAGVTAAGAVVGGALSSIREESKGDYEDHSRWSEEASAKVGGAINSGAVSSSSNMPRALGTMKKGESGRKVAVVVSAETRLDAASHEDTSYLQEHASILSHLPEHIDDDCRIFILIYSPDLQNHPLNSTSTGPPPTSLTSSYSNIGHEDLQRSNEDLTSAAMIPSNSNDNSNSRMFNALYSQAKALVDRESMIMPFTTRTGYVDILRHIHPSIVYVQGVLSGDNGGAVKQVSEWAGQVVLVVGDDTGHGGLVDSEDEHGASAEEHLRSWWKDDQSVGLGKGIEVVEGLRVGEDWKRRVKGHD